MHRTSGTCAARAGGGQWSRRFDTRGRTGRGNGGGFTLVEILIVVVILAILAAMVVPRFSKATTESLAAATGASVRGVQQKVLEYRAIHGAYPAEIDPAWFTSRSLPVSPFSPQHPVLIEYDNSGTAANTHPRNKYYTNTTGVFWYNPANGRFRARVALQNSTTNTLALYNKANGSSVSSYFGQTE